MSNPNTNAVALSRRNSSHTNARVVYIGKDSQPVFLPKMVSVNCPSWEKAASFGILEDTVYSLSESHTVADLVNLASNELPLDTGAAFQEAQSAAGEIMDQVIRFDNLEHSPPLLLKAKQSKLKMQTI